MLDFGAVAATPGGIPAPFGQLAAAVLAGDGPATIRLARQAGALPPDAQVDPRLIIELLHPLAATGAGTTFTYSRAWLRGLMTHLTQPRFAPALRNLTPPPQYALLWRATLSAAGLFAQLGATVPTRGSTSPTHQDSAAASPLPGPGKRTRRSAMPAEQQHPKPAHRPPQAAAPFAASYQSGQSHAGHAPITGSRGRRLGLPNLTGSALMTAAPACRTPHLHYKC